MSLSAHRLTTRTLSSKFNVYVPTEDTETQCTLRSKCYSGVGLHGLGALDMERLGTLSAFLESGSFVTFQTPADTALYKY